MTAPVKPSIQWTDTIGAATLTCIGLTFRNWTPDWDDVGESEAAVGDGATYFFLYRTDHLASFEISQIANTELKLALRLKSHLRRGGTITINTQDSESRVYTSVVAPGTVPTLEISDTTELEYTFKAVVKNTNEDADVMLYTPEAHARASLIVLSPSPLSISATGDPVDVTATLTDALGNPVAGITLSAISESTGAFTVSPSSGTTDGSGHVVFTVTPVAGGSGNLTVSTPGAHTSDVITVTTGVYGISSPAPILWLKPESISGSAVDGLAVATWPDDSPHAWDMTAMVSNGGGTDPKWDAAEGALRFASADSNAYENAAFNDFASSSEYTLFVVTKSASAGGCVMSTSSSDWWEGYQVSNRYRTDLGSFGDSSYYAFVDDLAAHVHETRYNGALSGSSRLVQLMDSTSETLTQFGLPTSFSSGGGMCIGHGSGLGFFNGWIKEVLLFPARLSDADCASVAGQLATKYGI